MLKQHNVAESTKFGHNLAESTKFANGFNWPLMHLLFEVIIGCYATLLIQNVVY